MKRSVPPLLFLGILAFAQIGCGGSPSNFTSHALTGPTPSAPSPSSNNAAPSSNGGSSLPTPPANATVLDQIQNTADNWTSCSVCAQGTNDTTNFWMAPNQSSPSITGSSRQFYVGGPQWTNALFIKTFFDNLDKTHFIWDFYVYWDSSSMANVWTAEFDVWQSINGTEFMIGSQCNFGDGYWDIWDQKNNKWLHSNVNCGRMAPNQWHHIQWYTYRDNSKYYYDTLVVDGQAYQIGRSFETSQNTWANSMGVQWQLDQSNTGVDIHEWIDNVRLTMW